MPGVLPRLSHKQIGVGKALDPYGYGIIPHVKSLDTLVQAMPETARHVLSALEVAQRRYSLLPVETADCQAPFPLVVGLSDYRKSLEVEDKTRR